MAFLDRFRDSDQRTHQAGSAAAKNASDEAIAAVFQNLHYVLNTKSGFGSFQKHFGLSEFSKSQSNSGAVALLQEELLQAIAHYEPRLSAVTLEPLGRDPELYVCFQLRAHCGEREVSARIRLHATYHNVLVERS